MSDKNKFTFNLLDIKNLILQKYVNNLIKNNFIKTSTSGKEHQITIITLKELSKDIKDNKDNKKNFFLLLIYLVSNMCSIHIQPSKNNNNKFYRFKDVKYLIGILKIIFSNFIENEQITIVFNFIIYYLMVFLKYQHVSAYRSSKFIENVINTFIESYQKMSVISVLNLSDLNLNVQSYVFLKQILTFLDTTKTIRIEELQIYGGFMFIYGDIHKFLKANKFTEEKKNNGVWKRPRQPLQIFSTNNARLSLSYVSDVQPPIIIKNTYV